VQTSGREPKKGIRDAGHPCSYWRKAATRALTDEAIVPTLPSAECSKGCIVASEPRKFKPAVLGEIQAAGDSQRTEGHGHSRQTPPGSTLGAGKRKGMGLNMCRQSIVDTPLDLKRKLEEFDRTKDRSVLINALIDQFLITRYDSATLIAKTKLAALEILIARMPKMSDNMLIKTIETLSQIGEVDMASIIGSGEVKR
jgi:hypothetical protein